MNLARKYRPRVLFDLVGQPVPVRCLTNALTNHTLHQAYLFTGKTGAGKSTAARVLAASENCENTPGITPCGKCHICLQIQDGKHADIIELDAAGEAGSADFIRGLKTQASYNPLDGAKTKYFILNEIQNISITAFDALLCLFEEPPPRVRFIITTTEPQKIRSALVGRCQQYDFRAIYWSTIAERLKFVSQKEELEAEEGAINICARFANGSMRNGLQNLEKLMSYSGGNILKTEDAEKLFGAINDSLYYSLFNQAIGIGKDGNLVKPDMGEGYKIISTIVSSGADPMIILQGIEEHIRNLILTLTTPKAMDFINISQTGLPLLKQQVLSCKGKLQNVLNCRQELNEVRKNLDYNFPLEGALLAWLVRCVHYLRS